MLSLAVAALIISSRADAAVAACRPALARKAGGEIADFSVTTTSYARGQTIVRGRVTIFVGMGRAPPGSASTHHLIRAPFDFRCWVRAGRVRKTTLAQPN